MDTLFRKKWVVVVTAIFCAVLWGSAFPVLKTGYAELQMETSDTISKIVFAGMRFFLAGLMLVIGMFFVKRKNLMVTKRQFLILIVFGIIQTAIQYYFFYNGLAKISGMQGSILQSSGTFFTVLLAHFFYSNDKLTWKKGFGLVAGFIGIIFSNWGQELQISFQFTGEGYMILAGLTGAIATIMAKELAVGIHPFALTGWQFILGSTIMLAIGYPQLETDAMTFTPIGWVILVYLAFVSAAAFALWFSILKFHKAGEISMFKFLTPVSGVILSAIFVPGENINAYVVGAMVLISIGILAVNYKGREKPHGRKEQRTRQVTAEQHE